MATYGRETLSSVGRSIKVSADGAPIQKVGGVTVDWSLITALAADQTFLDADFVASGEKFIRYGTILCKVTATGRYAPFGAAGTGALVKGDCYILNESVHENSPHSNHPGVIDGGRVWKQRLIVKGVDNSGTGMGDEVQTITLGAGNTGGTFTITYSGQTTSALAYNASAAAVQTALEALSNIAPGDVSVSLSGLVYSIKFQGTFENTDVAAVTTTPSLTGGANTATVATLTAGVDGPSLATFEAAFPNISYVPEA